MIDAGRDFERLRDYVSGRLSDEECRTFEDRLGRDPELVRELEQTLRLQDGLAQLEARGYFATPAAASRTAVRQRQLELRHWLPALAAAAVSALALFLWVQPRANSSGVLRAAANPPVAAHFNFMAMRSSGSPALTLPSAGSIELNVLPSAHASVSSFRVTLLREDTAVGVMRGLTPGRDGQIRCYVDARRLTAGNYSLRVEPDSGAGAAPEFFAFKLRSAGTLAQ
ncbi:MAG TPA: hypothetical protein VNX02_05950 [Steroidobacteraceae bacterium]|jgi:hypothetical protein|nr:hypothetical protein [Steroidobacteraceae bacterium]